jgi:hypothetical protein
MRVRTDRPSTPSDGSEFGGFLCKLVFLCSSKHVEAALLCAGNLVMKHAA